MIPQQQNTIPPIISNIPIPFRWVGPVLLTGDIDLEFIDIPLSTYEKPLWPSVNRGAKVTAKAGGISVTLVNELMSRSVLLQAESAGIANKIASSLVKQLDAMQQEVLQTSRYAKLNNINYRIVGRLIYLRLEFTTGDASGHNMSTLASEAIINYVLRTFPQLKYRSISANFCSDKKTSAVNSILGRGKYVVAETTISAKLCKRYLRITPEEFVKLNYEKNLLGSVIAGSIASANAHAANMLLAIYLATGQDAANIVEGSQVINHAEVIDSNLYFSCTCPNIIVGTVGNGKDLPTVQQVLQHIGCHEKRATGVNSQRLAMLIAATILCGELSLLAALTNQGELMQSHIKYER